MCKRFCDARTCLRVQVLLAVIGTCIDRLLKDIENDCERKEVKTLNIRNKEVINFLCRAKKLTYAGNGMEKESSRPKSHDLIYDEGIYKYIDTYLGGERFSGEEAVWVENNPYWAMNYSGRVLDDDFSGKFLKEVLSAVNVDYPYRGPLVYENSDYKYHCIVSGEFEWFRGYEEIYFNCKKIYECIFHGGIIL